MTALAPDAIREQCSTRVRTKTSVEQCPETATHKPCCSAHGKPQCCKHYCRTHFVEVNQCTPADHQGDTT